eukprot:949367_1
MNLKQMNWKTVAVAFILSIIVLTFECIEYHAPLYVSTERDIDIYVSLTTTPGRLLSLEPVLFHLCCNQTYKPTKVIIGLPLIFGRTNTSYEIPWFLSNSSIINDRFEGRVEVVRLPTDYGPISKLYTALYHYKQHMKTNDLIFYVDDDRLYKPCTISNAYKAWTQCSTEYDKCAVGTHGGWIGKPVVSDLFGTIYDGTTLDVAYEGTSVLMGFGGVILKYGDLSNKWMETNVTRACFVSDDIAISAMLSSHDVHKRIVNDKCWRSSDAHTTSDSGNQLHKTGSSFTGLSSKIQDLTTCAQQYGSEYTLFQSQTTLPNIIYVLIAYLDGITRIFLKLTLFDKVLVLIVLLSI